MCPYRPNCFYSSRLVFSYYEDPALGSPDTHVYIYMMMMMTANPKTPKLGSEMSYFRAAWLLGWSIFGLKEGWVEDFSFLSLRLESFRMKRQGV